LGLTLHRLRPPRIANRLDGSVKWNRAVEDGGVTLGHEVKIEITVEGVRARS
jgi:hypothetical protein